MLMQLSAKQGGAGGGSLSLGKRDAADDEADEAQHKAERGDGHGVAAQAEFEKANFETGFSLDRRGGLKPLWVPGAFQLWVRGSRRTTAPAVFVRPLQDVEVSVHRGVLGGFAVPRAVVGEGSHSLPGGVRLVTRTTLAVIK